ncbi:MAG TPA: glycosyltransferase family 39 protein [Bryobacterales bacterium]|jgi:4-amino-4-deoxy-L-arabinose transferase-like glycosyltransferase|nr:glycosyltransferase family 39 protein [Bryobacterales bacterium]
MKQAAAESAAVKIDSGTGRLWPLAAIGILLLYNAATLGRVPAFPNDDDGCYASAAYQFWNTGRPGVPGYQDAAGLGADVWAFGRTAAAFQGLFLHFGGVSLLHALLPSFLAGLGVLTVTAALAAVLWDRQTAVLAPLLLAASGKFFDACRWARPDMLLALFFLLSLWLAASARPGKPYVKLAAAGLAMGLSGDVHLNGFLIAFIPFLFWLFLRREPARVRWLGGAIFSAGVAAGVLFWLRLHYWPNPQAMLHQAAVYGGKTHGLRIADLGLAAAFKMEIQRYTDWFWDARGHRHALEGLCILAAGVWLWLREGRTGRALVAAWSAFFAVALLFMSNRFGWYLILPWPLFAIWMARLFQAFPARRIARGALALLLAACALNLGLWHWKARQDVPFSSRLAELRRVIPGDDPVLGNDVFWFAFWDKDFTSSEYLYLRRLEAENGRGPDASGWIAAQQRRKWRYIVASGELRLFLDPDFPLPLAVASRAGREDEIRQARAFSLERCSVVRRFAGVADTILVLRVNENNPDVAR